MFAAPSIATIVLAAGLASTASGASIAARDSTITWTKCDGFNSTDVVDCGTIKVPLNHDDPSGETITLGLARLKATGSDKLGSLILNNGGPGEAPSAFPLAQASGRTEFGAEISSRYDIVGLDPRGVGSSTPLKCDPDIYNERISTFANTPQKFQALVAHNKALGDSCAKLTGELFNHIDTISVVKDMEIVRQALGDEKLNFLGLSYGTQIGQQYAELYPTNVGRMALDGLLDHSQGRTSTFVADTFAYEDTLGAFFTWCNTTSACVWQGQNQPAMIEELFTRAQQTPIDAPGCTDPAAECRPNVTGEELIYNANSWLINKSPKIFANFNWPVFSEVLDQAYNHNNATLLSSSVATSETSSLYPFISILCEDWHADTSYVDVVYTERIAAELSPMTQGICDFQQVQARCAGWPAPLPNPERYLSKAAMAQAPKALLVNSKHDPATPLIWANGVREQWPQSPLIERIGGGHTSYFLRGKTNEVMDHFFLTGELPKNGQRFSS